MGEVWSQQGHAFIDDTNGQFGDGYAAVPFSNDGHNRWSTARSYLTETVRDRANLEIWSSNPERAARVAARLEAGNIWINQHLRLAPHIPLSPAKHSGMGTELTLAGVKDFAQMIILDIAK